MTHIHSHELERSMSVNVGGENKPLVWPIVAKHSSRVKLVFIDYAAFFFPLIFFSKFETPSE